MSLRKLLKDWNPLANKIFRTDHSKMKLWESWLDWIVTKTTGLTIAGGLVPYPVENMTEVTQVSQRCLCTHIYNVDIHSITHFIDQTSKYINLKLNNMPTLLGIFW